MAYPDYLILVGMGGLFIIIGLLILFLGRGEEKGYYDSIAARPDVREFLEHRPTRPQPQALKIGGRMAVIVGLLMVAIGGGFWLWG